MDAPSRIVVVGGGAMGGLFAASFAQAGFATTIYDTSVELVDRINAKGIQVATDIAEIDVSVDATTDTGLLGDAELVLFLVKSFRTEAAIAAIAATIDTNATVMTLQNGWGNGDLLATAFGPERTVLGVTYVSSMVDAPGKVRARLSGPTLVGPFDGGAGRADGVATVLRRSGFEVERPPLVAQEIWKKLVLNVATLPTSALTGLHAGALVGAPTMRGLVEEVAREAVAVGVAVGYDLDLAERIEVIHQVLDAAGSGRSSMLQDVQQRRPTEVDVLNGAVIRLAESNAIEVPANRALYSLIKGYEYALEFCDETPVAA